MRRLRTTGTRAGLALAVIAAPAVALAADASAVLYDRDGRERGVATFAATEAGVAIAIRAEGLAPGAHPTHIHEFGDCSAPDFSSAGGHFAPEMDQGHMAADDGDGVAIHVLPAGDLPDLTVGDDGVLAVELVHDRISLAPGAANTILDADGSALIVHADGEAAERILCGVIAMP